MKLLFDQNISHRILNSLSSGFEGSSSVKNEGLMDQTDFAIWKYAKQHGFVIVTQDSDFNDFSVIHGFPPKIIWIRNGNYTTMQLVFLLESHFKEIENFLSNPEFGCLEILMMRK